MTLSLICPYDRSPVSEIAEGLVCTTCGKLYPIEGGVVRTLERSDAFYEGAYENQVHFHPRDERLRHAWPLWLINGGYLWNVRRFVSAGATVVELGCASGVRYFGQRYRMVGCDLSFLSLQKLRFYEHRIQVDAAKCIPLSDGSVDAVVCSYFWEHIPPAIKPRILRECRRILRPGGRLVFLYDVETNNPLIRYYKRVNRSLYQKLFLDGDGHCGYQSPAANLAIFAEAGFHLVKHHGLEKTWLQSPAAYIKLAKFGPIARRLFGGGFWLGRQPLIYPYTALLRLIDTVISPWLPTDWARMDLVVCETRSLQ